MEHCNPWMDSTMLKHVIAMQPLWAQSAWSEVPVSGVEWEAGWFEMGWEQTPSRAVGSVLVSLGEAGTSDSMVLLPFKMTWIFVGLVGRYTGSIHGSLSLIVEQRRGLWHPWWQRHAYGAQGDIINTHVMASWHHKHGLSGLLNQWPRKM